VRHFFERDATPPFSKHPSSYDQTHFVMMPTCTKKKKKREKRNSALGKGQPAAISHVGEAVY
jgi:hypothetical protein